MKKYILGILIILYLYPSLFSQNNNIKEITEVDVTAYKEITATDIAVFGIHLGMSPDDVHYILMKNRALDYEVDKIHGTTDIRIYVYDKDETGMNKNCILYLIWENLNPELSSITFFEDFAPYLIGKSSTLLSTQIFDEKSEISNFTGKYNRSEITLNIPSIQTKHTTFFYDPKGFKITLKKDGDNSSVTFGIYSKK